jgi:uncharacterized protein with von Willebrand factor type A (vWA) domain
LAGSESRCLILEHSPEKQIHQIQKCYATNYNLLAKILTIFDAHVDPYISVPCTYCVSMSLQDAITKWLNRLVNTSQKEKKLNNSATLRF